MAKRQAVEDSSEPQKREVTGQEIRNLQEQINRFKQKRINGELVSPFYQYMMECDILKFRNGEWFVKDPISFQWFSEVEDRRKALEAWKKEQDGTRLPIPSRPEGLVKRL